MRAADVVLTGRDAERCDLTLMVRVGVIFPPCIRCGLTRRHSKRIISELGGMPGRLPGLPRARPADRADGALPIKALVEVLHRDHP